MNKQKIYLNKIYKFKSDLDKMAELGWQEEKTKSYIIKNLGRNFYWSKKTALVYKLGRGKPVFFRAELDALKTPKGIKHMCGHSLHSSVLMAVYLYLKNNPPKDYCIYFVFQPSEENYPSGAKYINDHLPILKECQVGFAFHVVPCPKTGRLFNPVFASGDYFEIEIKGRAVHIKDKYNKKNADALITAQELIKKINLSVNPDWIINVGTMQGGESPNCIAGTAKLTGDIRAASELARKKAESYFRKMCRETQKKYPKSKIELSYFKGYPMFKNDEKLLSRIKNIFKIEKTVKSFATEDFSLFPGPKILLLIGTGKETELHSDNFSIDKSLFKNLFDKWVIISSHLSDII